MMSLKKIANLDAQVEKALNGSMNGSEEFSAGDAKKLIYDLQNYRLELELQNQSLREAHLDLQKTKHQLSNLYNSAPVGYVSLDEKGRILKTNNTFRELIAWSSANLTGRLFTDFIDPSSKDIFNLILQAIILEKKLQQCELALIRSDKFIFPADFEGILWSDPILGEDVIQITISDISARKKAEEAMYRAQKLESLGVMAGGVAHDFNNLMTAILNQNILAQRKLAKDHPSHINIEKSLQAIRRAAQLTKQLLDFTGQSHVKKEVLNVNEIVSENVDLLRATFPSTVGLRTHFAEEKAMVEADPGQIQQVLINLIINAAEAYEGQTGQVEVRTRTIRIDKDVLNSVDSKPISKGTYIQIDVQDYAQGMNEETVNRIFDPFFTTKFTGRGLGLAAMQGILKIHNGAILLQTSPGKGSKFTVLFPAHLRIETDLGQTSNIRSGQVNYTLMVIDDELFVRESLAEVLKIEGFQVLTAENGQRAIQLFQYFSHKIGLIVCDLTMSVMSGAETIRRLRNINPDLPVIVISGYGEAKAREELKGLEPYEFMAKPLDIEKIIERISILGNGWGGLDKF